MTQAIQPQQKGIQISDAALQQVKFLRDRQGTDLCLRVGVRQGGCSGMSYLMDFEDPSKITPTMKFMIMTASKLYAIARAYYISMV